MPTSEAAFRNGNIKSGQTLQDAIANGLGKSVGSLTFAVIAGHLLWTITTHLRQLQQDVKEKQDNIQRFWGRHQQLVNDTTGLIAKIADTKEISRTDPFSLFLNMCLNGYLITLFQTASTFANEYSSSLEVGARLRYRARQAAEEIISTMQQATNLDIRRLFPTTPCSLYLASSVFILDLKAGHNIEHAAERLRFILHHTIAFSKVWDFSELFLTQLMHNLEDCDINLELAQADSSPMKSLEGMGRWSAMGPLFVADPALVEPNKEPI